MALTDLIPWTRNPVSRGASFGGDRDPLSALTRDMNRILDDFTRGFGWPTETRTPWSSGWPHVEVSETETEVKVIAELPGLDEKDVEISLNDNVLVIKGEKKLENKGALYSERWQGQFQRSLQLGSELDPENVGASFKNGVLTVTLAKRPEAQTHVKRIPIKAA